ncbi:hypothetical protein TNCT_662061 [Trichonephila clavata]|uniref:Uncharacterized protein n=1 Tax=Trichonephila clavata TaxID=2740835 RepID=A0A8X6LYN0_TRICU|nr:hypothetical protein TNCT_662061 [Trichonephila clavata]
MRPLNRLKTPSDSTQHMDNVTLYTPLYTPRTLFASAFIYYPRFDAITQNYPTELLIAASVSRCRQTIAADLSGGSSDAAILFFLLVVGGNGKRQILLEGRVESGEVFTSIWNCLCFCGTLY